MDAAGKKLGRGIGALLHKPVEYKVAHESIQDSVEKPAKSPGSISDELSVHQYIRVDRILPSPYQPRQRMDDNALLGLVESVRRSGVIQPIVVRKRGDKFELVAGERRWRAAQQAGLDTIPAIVRDLSDSDAAEWALVENVQREDLNPIDRAAALRKLMEKFALTQEQIAERIGLERSTVANLLRLNALEPEVAELVAVGKLTQGHAKALLSLPAGGARQHLAKSAAMMGWSVRRLEVEIAREHARLNGSGGGGGGSETPRAAVLRDLEKQIGQKLGTKVSIVTDRQGKHGRLIIEFYGIDHFEDMLTRLGVHAQS